MITNYLIAIISPIFLFLNYGMGGVEVRTSGEICERDIGLEGSARLKRKDYALFFAVEDYEDPITRDLKNPVRDAEAIATVLFDTYGFDTIIYRNPNSLTIKSVLSKWQQKSFHKKSQLFVFFSGHGVFDDVFNEGHFVPADAIIDDYQSQLRLISLGNGFTKIDCNHILIAVDACYSGTIDREVAFKGPKNNVLDSLNNTFLNRLLRYKSRLFITSGGKERTPDGIDHSPFTQAILRGLKEEYLRDGAMTFNDLCSYLEQVRPTPREGMLYGHEGGSFIFFSKKSNQPFEMNADASLEEQPKMTSVVRAPFVLSGHIFDNDSNAPLSGVRVTMVGQDVTAISDSKGHFKVRISDIDQATRHANLRFYHSDFEPRTRSFPLTLKSNIEMYLSRKEN